MSGTPLGRFCWFELLTSDPHAAPGFYGPITGWETSLWEGGSMPYTMWMNGEKSLGGIMELPEQAKAMGAPPHWLAYISTPDLDRTVENAKELGATILHSMDIPQVGRIAVVQDPQGAVFSAYQPSGDAPGHDGRAEVGEVSWHELMSSDADGAWSFYSTLFGWQKADAMDMGEMGMYQTFGRGVHPIGGMMKRPPEMPVSAWLFYVRVPDAAAAAEKVKELGGQVLHGPMEVPGGDQVAVCCDAQGAAFGVHAVKPG